MFEPSFYLSYKLKPQNFFKALFNFEKEEGTKQMFLRHTQAMS